VAIIDRYLFGLFCNSGGVKIMPFRIGWLDEKLHIYDIVLSDPFTFADQDQFFAEFFKFMDAGPVPMYGIFDVSKWSQSGAAGLNDPRFRRMGEYRKKIVVIVMVTKNKVTAAMGRLGAAVVGYRDWMRFEESREKASKYLKERATNELAQRELAKEQARASQGEVKKVEVPPATAPKEQAASSQAAKAEVPPAPKKDEVPKAAAPKVETPKDQMPKKDETPKAQEPKAEAPKDQTSKKS